jgi:hypothetical protein
MNTRPKLSSLLPTQVPEFVREDYTTFIDFLKAYYEFVDQNYDSDIAKLRDLDTTLDSFIEQFKNELAHNVPYSVVNERFLLEKIKDQYLAKGSEASFKLLFKLLFNKNVVVDYPSKQILRASDGRWNQDVSVFVYVNAGDPADVVGKIVDVITPNRIIRVQVDKRQYVELEVDNVVQIAENIYELFIDRRFFGDINAGDKIRYSDTFDATILSTTSLVFVERPGKKFKVGELYEIKNGNGKGSILKVARVDTEGGIEAMEFVRYGIGYINDFTSTLLPYGGTSNTTAGTTSLNVSGTSPNIAVAFGETTNGFFELGIINRSDYNTQTPEEALAQGVGLHWDGTYVGETVREFFVDNKATVLDPDEPAVVKVILGANTKYPGYFSTNDGFLDDAIFIQDSKYYQAYAYVLKIDERLDTYRSAVKTLLHPAGMALFGEFDIRNEFDLGTSLEFALKYLVITLQDEVQTEDLFIIKDIQKGIYVGNYLYDGVTLDNNEVVMLSETGTGSSRTVPYLTTTKPLSTHKLNDGSTADENIVTPSDSDPVLGFSKRVNSSYLYDGVTLDDNTVTPSEETIDYEYGSLTRKGISIISVDKLIFADQYPHYLNDGTTLGIDTFTLSDTTGTNGTRTVPYFEFEKLFDSVNYDHKFYDFPYPAWELLTSYTANTYIQSGGYVYRVDTSGTSSSTPPSHTSGSILNGTVLLTYFGVVGNILDDDTVTISEGELTINKFLNKYIDSTTVNYDEDVELEEVIPTDSGGSLWLNPYTDPYPITSSYFENDSGNYTTGESAFTG